MKKETSLLKVKNHRIEDCYLKRIFILCVAAVFIIFGACALFGNLMTSAHSSFKESPVNVTCYKSIQIKPGDTLWDIAEAYVSDDNHSIAEFVTELKEVNSLKGDEIEAGRNLIVPYNHSLN